MKKRLISFVLVLLMVCTLLPFGVSAAGSSAVNTGSINLSLKYSGGGSINKYSVQEATIGTPACGDVDGDGKNELIFTALSIYCTDGATGKIEWSVNSGHDRSKSGEDYGRTSVPAKIADIDGDGKREIITFQTNYAYGKTCIGVYDGKGNFKSGWPVYTNYPVNAAVVADLNGDGRSEICIGMGVGYTGDPAVAVYNCTGKMCSGWPQVCGCGLYSDSMTAADLDGNGSKELVLLMDDSQIYAFNYNGSAVKATGGVYEGIDWCGLPVCENIDHEYVLANWARNHGGKADATSDIILGPTREEKNCIEGTDGGIVASDVDGDGKTELVCAAMMVDGSKVMRDGSNSYASSAQYFTAFILNTDRTRYKNEKLGYDWTQMPVDNGKILAFDNSKLETAKAIPVAADLDGDGMKEILFTSNDGKMHCFSLDGKEHGKWPCDLNSNSSVLTFASKPVAADVNGDGRNEVVFTTYTDKNQKSVRGCVYVLDYNGKILAKQTLPVMWGSDKDVYYANGSMAQPCVADIDKDGKLEIAVTTLSAGVVAYELSCNKNTVGFSDVYENEYYTDAVLWAVGKGITKGVDASHFAPGNDCTRGQIVTFLWRANGCPGVDGIKNPFVDVAKGSYCYEAVLWAVKEGITKGFDATHFKPNESCTRGQVVTFLWRADGQPSYAHTKCPFTDVSKGAFYYDAMMWAVENGITKGTDASHFAPNNTCTRGQIVTFLYRDMA